MKKLVLVITLLSAILLGGKLNYVTSNEIDYLNLNESNNFVFVEETETIDISTIRFSNYYGRVQLSEGTISNISSGISLVENILTVNEVGINYFDFTYSSITNRVYFISKSVDDLNYSLYSEDFDLLNNGGFPTNLDLTDGDAQVIDNVLELDSVTETTKLFFPEMINGFSSYSVDFDFSFDETNSSSRWIALMFRGSDNNFYQIIVRQGGTIANGVELSKSTNGSTSTLVMVPFDTEFVLGQSYHLTASIEKNELVILIDDQSVLTYDGLTDYTNGYIGIQSNGNIASIDNIEIQYSAELLNDETHNFMSVPRLYKTSSNAVKSPSIISYMNTLEDVNDLANIVRPHTAIFVLDDNLNVLDEDGEIMMTAYDALLNSDGVVIPAFEVNSLIAAQSIGELLKEHNIIDVFVTSTDYELILEAHEIHQYVRGVLKVEYDSSKEMLSDEELLELTFQANLSYSNAIMLPLEYANQDYNFYFHNRLLYTWVSDEGSSIGESSKAIFSGADGIVTTSAFAVISILQGLPENSVLSKPIIIGHRGMPSKGPENTVEGSQLAVDAGADAIELDIRLSSDDKIIVMHDSTTTRTTGVSKVVENTTYDELRALEILDPANEFDPIFVPGLEQFFIQFQDQENMLVIEIKDGDVLIVDKLKELIDEYPNIRDQVIVISFNPSQMNKMKEVIPEYPLAYLNSAMADDPLVSIENTLKMLVPMGAISNINYANASEEYLSEFSHRGISSIFWTINNPTDMYDFYLIGSSGFTTDNTYLFEDSWNVFTLNETSFELIINSEDPVDDDFTIRGMISTPNGLEYPHNPKYEIIDDGGTGIEFNDTNSLIGATNEGTVYIRTYFETFLPNGEVFVVFGDVITITVTDVYVEIPVCEDDQTLTDGECVDNVVLIEPQDPPSEPMNPLFYIPIIGGGLIVIGTGFIISKKALKF